MELSTLQAGSSTLIKTVYIADKPLRMLIDSGASPCILKDGVMDTTQMPMIQVSARGFYGGAQAILRLIARASRSHFPTLTLISLWDLRSYAIKITFEEFRQRLEAGVYAEVHTVETARHKGTNPVAAEIRVMMHEFQDVSQEELPDRLPPERDVEHEIALRSGAVPAARAPLLHSPVACAALAAYVSELLRKGWIAQSDSPWTSSIFAAPQKDPVAGASDRKVGWIRAGDISHPVGWAIHYRYLNSQTTVPRIPLSRIDDVLDTLQATSI
ncbi:unnamed protein product [Phytophthora fragariaefolia]|uniref:Unnamed protein product n=1 Tax=Phytophthora fragariaefolia TaxID=1490495 RepID=A0A9W6X3W8_9STRA|nr:unnamed protein product [Phytophthora fragariaefolia]